MFVSVVIPVYNRESMVERAVRSVLAQTYENFELIVIDDGSTDNSLQTVSRIAREDGRIKVFATENKGVSAARNLAISRSSGDVIALLDSDDEWLADKLESQIRFMAESGFEICQTDEIWMRKEKRVNPGFKHAKFSGWFLEQSFHLCLISPSCVMFTRNVWNKTGPFDESFFACEDFDLWLRTSALFACGLLPRKLTIRHGGRPDQLSGSVLGLDLYRIYALKKGLESGLMSKREERSARAVLRSKLMVYRQGCLKRDKPEEAQRVKDLLAPYL